MGRGLSLIQKRILLACLRERFVLCQDLLTLTVGGNDDWPSLTVGTPDNPGTMVLGNVAASSPYDNGTYEYHGLVTQKDGYVTVYGNLVLGQNGETIPGLGPAIGVYELNNGSLDVAKDNWGNNGNLIVGAGGKGLFNQSGDSYLTVEGDLILGDQTGSFGTLNKSGDYSSTYIYGNLVVGNFGAGEVNHSGGGLYADGGVILGQKVGSSGTYNFELGGSDGYLSARSMTVGQAGTGTVNHNDGPVYVYGSLILGQQSTGTGTYNLNGGYLEVGYWGGNLIVGDAGTGTFNQSGGTAKVYGDIILGNQPGSYGAYTLRNAASLEVGSMVVGAGGYGRFDQWGSSTVTVNNDLVIGQSQPFDTPTYSLRGGTLTVLGNAIVGDTGAGGFEQWGGALNVGGSLILGRDLVGSQGGFLHFSADATTQVTGDMVVGQEGGGTVYHQGGKITVGYGGSGNLYLAQEPGSVGEYYQLNGNLTVNGKLTVGDQGYAAVFYQPFMLYTPGLTDNPVTQVNGNMVVGANNQGEWRATVREKLGSITVTGDLTLGQSAGATGRYFLNTPDPTFADPVPPNPVNPNLNKSTLTVGGTLVVGEAGTGIFEMGGGSLTTYGNIELGRSGGTGTFTQTGGSVTTVATGVGNQPVLVIGRNTGTGNYNLSGDGSLDVGGISVGFENLGTFTQSGGTINTGHIEISALPGSQNSSMVQSGGSVFIDTTHPGGDGGMTIGREAGAVGSYEMNGVNASLNTQHLYVGDSGTGTLTQSAGSLTVSGGHYLVGNVATDGHYSDGKVYQSGGTTTVTNGYLVLGWNRQSSANYARGQYDLSGSGYLDTTLAKKVIVGGHGQGEFNQSGNSTHDANIITLGRYNDGIGSYNISDSATLTAKSLIIGQEGTGSFLINSNTVNITVSQDLTIGPQGSLQTAPGVSATINMTGSNFINKSTDPANVDMTGLRMFFSNNPFPADTFEVAGTNGDGFSGNFGLGTLQLGPGNVLLVDAFDNNGNHTLGDEVLYVAHLIIGAGSTLDLNGLYVFYGDIFNNGDLLRADHLQPMNPVPLPGSAWLLLSGLAGLWGFRRFRA